MSAHDSLHAALIWSTLAHGVALSLLPGEHPGPFPSGPQAPLQVQLATAPSALALPPIAVSPSRYAGLATQSGTEPGLTRSNSPSRHATERALVVQDAQQPMEPTASSIDTRAEPPRGPEQSSHGSVRAEVFVAPLYGLAHLDNPRPEYPSTALRQGIEGSAIMRVRVGSDGRALAVELERTSGDDRLDRAALKAVKLWRFVPARLGDNPIEADAVFPVSFHIGG